MILSANTATWQSMRHCKRPGCKKQRIKWEIDPTFVDPASKKMPQASKAEAAKADGILQDSALAELDQVHLSYQGLIY